MIDILLVIQCILHMELRVFDVWEVTKITTLGPRNS